ncbi:hypothetical protein GEMRC1_000219 [Eukaryota sp. GEM-RC1]
MHLQQLIDTFRHQIQLRNKATAVLAVELLVTIIEESDANTIMDLNQQISEATDEMKKVSRAISLTAGIALFRKFVSRTSDEFDFQHCKSIFIDRGKQFVEHASNAKEVVSKSGPTLFLDGSVILTHGYSRVVCHLLACVAQQRQISVIVTESSPMNNGYQTAEFLINNGVPVSIIADSAVASIMSKVTMVLLGADGITESGGIINQIGSCGICMIARHLGKSCYVAAESYKFTRLFPLDQDDVEQYTEHSLYDTPYREDVDMEALYKLKEQKVVDYTPPQLIDLLITDIGILAPSAVSDELIKLYV